jgi:magnesium chelatase family protein
VDVPRLPVEVLQATAATEASADVAERVSASRERQLRRQGCANARLGASALALHCRLDANCAALLQRAMKKLSLSARGYHRVLRAARTIADLAVAAQISPAHLAEAIALRQLDRRSDALHPGI